MKNIFIIFLIFAIGVFSYLKLSPNAGLSNIYTNKENPTLQASETHSPTKTEDRQSPNDSPIDPQKAYFDVQDFFYEDSVFDEDNKNKDYETYSDETLEILADGGDIFAMKTLSMRLLNLKAKLGVDNPNFTNINEKYKHYVKLAVLHGDGEMIAFMPELSPRIPRIKDGEIARNDAVIHNLAIAEFFGLRGRLEDKYVRQREVFIYFFPEKDSITDAEIAEVKFRGKQIYDQYERERIELGLGPFDNSISEGMQAYFAEARRSHIEQIGDLAFD